MKKGGFPVINSYKKQPNVHQSTEFVYGCSIIISGAIYSGVPHIEYILSVHGSSNFDNPKSVIFGYPSLQISTFSGFKLRKFHPIMKNTLYM